MKRSEMVQILAIELAGVIQDLEFKGNYDYDQWLRNRGHEVLKKLESSGMTPPLTGISKKSYYPGESVYPEHRWDGEND